MPGSVGGGRSGGGARGGGFSGGIGGFYGGAYGNRNYSSAPTPHSYNSITGKQSRKIVTRYMIAIILAILILPIIFCIELGSEIAKPDTEQTLSVASVERTKLSSFRCTPVDKWLEDKAVLLRSIDEKTQVEAALAHFYEKTGVQPYLLILDAIDGNKNPDWNTAESYLTNRYIELFGQDEGHYIFLYFHHRDSSYTLYYIPGLDAMTVVDDEVSSMLMDCMEWYYRQTDTYGEMFANAFLHTAQMIEYPQRQEPSVEFSKPQTGIDIYGFSD